jgi:hypothetical protein
MRFIGVCAHTHTYTRTHTHTHTHTHIHTQELPPSYNNYLACTLHIHEWYTITITTRVFVEQLINGSYYSHWTNRTATRAFQPNAITHTQERQWMDKLVNVKIRLVRAHEHTHTHTNSHESKCVSTAILMLDDHWPGIVTVTSYYTRNIDAEQKFPLKIGENRVVLGREFE